MNINTFSQELSQCTSVNACIKLFESYQKNPNSDIRILTQSIIEARGEEKRLLGPQLSQLRSRYSHERDARIQALQAEMEKDTFFEFDPHVHIPSLLLSSATAHTLHPVTQVEREIVSIFERLGFDVYDSNHIQTQYNNFTSVGTPDYHPARGMQDTFFIDEKDEQNELYVLRTQVTAQIVEYATHVSKHRSSLRVIFPGIVYRAETIDATHDCMFHQTDFWMVDKSLTNSQMFSLIRHVLRTFFEDPTLQIRFRPSYFPFTQPSYEIDIFAHWFKGGKWIEIAGCGPIHKDVLTHMGIDHTQYTGLAAGFGLTRLAQLKLHVTGLPQFYNGSLAFIRGKK